MQVAMADIDGEALAESAELVGPIVPADRFDDPGL